MKIIKEKSLNLTFDEMLEAIKSGKAPKNCAMNVTSEDIVIFESLDKYNLFGVINDEYETVYYED